MNARSEVRQVEEIMADPVIHVTATLNAPVIRITDTLKELMSQRHYIQQKADDLEFDIHRTVMSMQPVWKYNLTIEGANEISQELSTALTATRHIGLACNAVSAACLMLITAARKSKERELPRILADLAAEVAAPPNETDNTDRTRAIVSDDQ